MNFHIHVENNSIILYCSQIIHHENICQRNIVSGEICNNKHFPMIYSTDYHDLIFSLLIA